jgi:Uma2 family endonuclease
METTQEHIDYTIEYTVEDLLDLPVHRVELEDGKIIPMAPSRAWHFDNQRRLAGVVEQRFPEVSGEILIRINDRSARSPDVVAFTGPVDRNRGLFEPDEIALVVEVVSPSTETADRVTKPVLYARVGIPEYWLVEQLGKSDDATVHRCLLDPGATAYRLAETTTLCELEKSAG